MPYCQGWTGPPEHRDKSRWAARAGDIWAGRLGHFYIRIRPILIFLPILIWLLQFTPAGPLPHPTSSDSQ